MNFFKMILIVLMVVLFSGCGEYDYTLNLVAFSDGSSVNGSFFLGCGSIDERPVYKYLWVQSDGGIRTGWTSALKSTVYERDNVRPSIQFVGDNWTGESWAYISIPVGSVKGEFEMDSK